MGDTVNLAQRLQEMARPGGLTILSEATWAGLTRPAACHAQPARARQGPGHPSHHLPDRARDVERLMTTTEPAVSIPEQGTDLVLDVRRVRRTFEAENAPVRALRGADFEMARGEFVAIMGPSGCGKSTLLNLVAGLDQADEGTIVLADEEVTGKTEDELARMRREHIGIVFQFFNLLEGMTVLENVALPAMIAGLKRKPAETRGRDLLDLLGLSDKAKAAPGSLSGGQRQRLAIARALANEPTLLLADEPTGALDSEGGHEVIELFRRLHQGGQTILMVTHDDDVAAAAQRIARMKDGKVIDAGDGAESGARLARPQPPRLDVPLHRYLLRADLRGRWRSLALLAMLMAVVVATVAHGSRRGPAHGDRLRSLPRRGPALRRGGRPGATAARTSTGLGRRRRHRGRRGVPLVRRVPRRSRAPQFFPMIVPDDDRVPDTYLRAPVVDGPATRPGASRSRSPSASAPRGPSASAVGDPLPVATFTDEQLAAGFALRRPPASWSLDVVGILRDPGDVGEPRARHRPQPTSPRRSPSEYGDEVGLFSVGALIGRRARVRRSTRSAATGVTEEYPVEFDTFFGAGTLRGQADPTLDVDGRRASGSWRSCSRSSAARRSSWGWSVRPPTESATTPRCGPLGVDRSGLLVNLSLAVGLAALVGAVRRWRAEPRC